MIFYYDKKKLQFWLVIEGVLFLAGLWRTILLILNKLFAYEYSGAYLDNLAPFATVIVAGYLFVGVRRYFFAGEAITLDPEGLELHLKFGSKRYEWSAIDSIQIVESQEKIGDMPIQHLELKVALSENAEKQNMLLSDVDFELTHLLNELERYFPAGVELT